MVTVFHFSNPFSTTDGVLRATARRGESINDWLHRQFGPDFEEFPVATLCQVNGEPLVRAKWSKRLKDDDVLVFTTLPGEPITIIIAIVAIAIAVATYLLIPDPTIPGDNTNAANNTYTLRGQTNRLRPNEPIEAVYGKCRIWPTYIARPYSRYIDNNAYQYSLFVLGQGSYDIEGLFFDDTNATAFDEVQTEVIQPGNITTLVEAAVYQALEVSNLELLGPNEPGYAVLGPYVINDFTNPIHRIEVDISFPQGLYKMSDKGKLTSYSIDLLFEYCAIDALGAAIGSWVTLIAPTVQRADNTPQRKTYSQGVPSGRYQIRGKRITNKSSSTKIVSQCKWEAAKGYARFANSFGGVTVIAVKALATNQLNDNTSKSFNVKATRKLSTWSSGGGWSGLTATRNPVWAFCDIFRASYGAKLDAAYLDMPTLKSLADLYDATGICFDWTFDQPLTVWEAAKTVLRVGRAVPVPQGSLITAVRDSATNTISGFFSAYNIVKGSLTKKLQMFEFNPFDGLVVEYVDPHTWKTREVDCVLPGRAGTNLERMKLPGCTDRTRALREGLYIQSRRELQRTTIIFRTGLEGLIPSYLDVIAITHDTVRVGQSGYVLAYNTATNEATLSEQPEFGDLSIVHRLALRAKDGTLLPDVINVTPGSAPNKVILASDPSVPFDFSPNQVPPLYAFGMADLWRFKGRVISVKPVDSRSVEITCVNYLDDSYLHDDTTAGDVVQVSVIANPGAPEIDRVDIAPVPDSADRIFVNWVPVAGTPGYQVQVSYDDANWSVAGTVAVPPVQLAVNLGTVWVRVAPFALGGNVIWTKSPSYVVGSNIALLPAPPITAQDPFTGLTAVAKWLSVSGATTGYLCEVWLVGGLVALRTIDAGLATEVSYTRAQFVTDSPSVNSRAFEFRVSATNPAGSGAQLVITLTNPVSVAPTAPTSGVPTGSVYPVSWTHTPEADFREYRVYADTVAGFTPGPANLVATVTSPASTVTAAVPTYWRVAALDIWGDDLSLSAEATLP